MTIEYEYRAEERIIRVASAGTLSLAQITEYFEKILREPEIINAVEIVDSNEVDTFSISYDEGYQLKETIARLVTSGKIIGSYLVAENDFRYGMTRMFTSIVETSEGYSIKAFRSFEEAHQMAIELKNSRSKNTRF